jgi:hypothetical protein
MFSYEEIFHLSGHVNRHNPHYWLDGNPCWMNDGMGWYWNNRIIGFYLFDEMSWVQ